MRRILPVICISLFLMMGCNEQPKPQQPIMYSGIPTQTVEVTGHWKMGEFTIGYRIITNEYIITSSYGGLFGQGGQSFGGPGLVPHATVGTFKKIVEIAEQAKNNNETLTFRGDLAFTKNGAPYLFEGKKVIILYDAIYKGQIYEVNRRPWDN